MKNKTLRGIIILISFLSVTSSSCTKNVVTPEPDPPAGTHTEYFVGSRNTSSVKRYDSTGAYIGDFVTPGSGGLNITQDLLFIHDSLLLVTGRGNTAIKKYNSETGIYIGNFSSGYTLDNPTKMFLAGGYIYVSQWGATQNKIARFHADGSFDREFSSVGVPNGLGVACDTLRNFYAASYGTGGNGKIFKFDSNGDFVSVFINTGDVFGPSNIWFNSTDDMFVADFTLGKVQRFNLNGMLLGTYISGMVNIEGFAFGSDGSLFLCDWTQNTVNKYDSMGNFVSVFISTGGLSSPNCIAVRQVNR